VGLYLAEEDKLILTLQSEISFATVGLCLQYMNIKASEASNIATNALGKYVYFSRVQGVSRAMT
jgi:hypothetical protein